MSGRVRCNFRTDGVAVGSLTMAAIAAPSGGRRRTMSSTERAETTAGESSGLVLFPDGLDRRTATHLSATLARRGLHDLDVWWSPDTDRDEDPLDDPEVKAEVRRFLRRLWTEVRTHAG